MSDCKFSPKAAHHWYNGEKRSARVFLPEMDEARELIASLVRTVLSEREVIAPFQLSPPRLGQAQQTC